MSLSTVGVWVGKGNSGGRGVGLEFQVCEAGSLISREGLIAVHMYRFPPKSLLDAEPNKPHIRLIL